MINKQLRALGVKDELVRGDRYFFFRGPVAGKWIVSTVEVGKVSDIPTIDGWYEAYEALRKKNSERGISAETKKMVAKKGK
jgi:hypothetical protein